MPKQKNLKLTELKVNSYITELDESDENEVKGGVAIFNYLKVIASLMYGPCGWELPQYTDGTCTCPAVTEGTECLSSIPQIDC